ncbi:MAG: hypothetical protein AAF360_09285 [Pseudomonadota bacterium]
MSESPDDEIAEAPESGFWREALVGASIGALVGLLIGLSVSETVGAVVAALLGLLGAVLGVGQVSAGPLRAGEPGRIAGFGIACAAMVAAGVYIRAHDALSPDIETQMNGWTAIGVPPEDARDLVIYQRLGLTPEGRAAGERPAPSAAASVLFSGEDGDACQRLDNPVYEDADILRDAMRAEGGAWAALADGRAATDDIAALRRKIQAICG